MCFVGYPKTVPNHSQINDISCPKLIRLMNIVVMLYFCYFSLLTPNNPFPYHVIWGWPRDPSAQLVLQEIDNCWWTLNVIEGAKKFYAKKISIAIR